jgi:hypothetical protein
MLSLKFVYLKSILNYSKPTESWKQLMLQKGKILNSSFFLFFCIHSSDWQVRTYTRWKNYTKLKNKCNGWDIYVAITVQFTPV